MPSWALFDCVTLLIKSHPLAPRQQVVRETFQWKSNWWVFYILYRIAAVCSLNDGGKLTFVMTQQQFAKLIQRSPSINFITCSCLIRHIFFHHVFPNQSVWMREKKSWICKFHRCRSIFSTLWNIIRMNENERELENWREKNVSMQYEKYLLDHKN